MLSSPGPLWTPRTLFGPLRGPAKAMACGSRLGTRPLRTTMPVLSRGYRRSPLTADRQPRRLTRLARLSRIGDAVAALKPNDITAKHECQYHTRLSLWHGQTLKSGTVEQI